jgi:phage-related baseplate assembly protein
VRQAYAHVAALAVGADMDEAAPGAAVTIRLCGAADHDGACTWPHHTARERNGDSLRLRILFACEPADEQRVREGIAAALSSDDLGDATWTLVSHGPAPVAAAEQDHAARLLAT